LTAPEGVTAPSFPSITTNAQGVASYEIPGTSLAAGSWAVLCKVPNPLSPYYDATGTTTFTITGNSCSGSGQASMIPAESSMGPDAYWSITWGLTETLTPAPEEEPQEEQTSGQGQGDTTSSIPDCDGDYWTVDAMSPTIANAGTVPNGTDGIVQSWLVTSYSYEEGAACNDDCGGSGYDSATRMASTVTVPFPYTCGSQPSFCSD
jgi:hypothetical protein